MSLFLSLLFAAGLRLAPTSDRAIHDYIPTLAVCEPEDCGSRLIVLRSFRQRGQARHLAVDPTTLKSRVVDGPLSLRPLRLPQDLHELADTPYGRALAKSERSAGVGRDAGLTHALPEEHGVVLTIDLCTSTHPLDRRLFGKVVETFSAAEQPVPIAVAITGRWMVEHPEDFAWLRAQIAERRLDITWIDHTFNHR